MRGDGLFSQRWSHMVACKKRKILIHIIILVSAVSRRKTQNLSLQMLAWMMPLAALHLPHILSQFLILGRNCSYNDQLIV